MMKTRHSLCSYTQNNSNVFAHALQLIYDIHTVTAKTRLSFCAHTHLCNAVNQSISIFWSIYMRRKNDQTDSHSHCKDTTQLLRTYTSVQRSKSIDFDFLINLHASQRYFAALLECNNSDLHISFQTRLLRYLGYKAIASSISYQKE